MGALVFLRRLSFARLAGIVLAVSVLAGFFGYAAVSTTNRGSTGAIAAENARIMAAERTSCLRHGSYGTLATLERAGLLATAPIYNSVVYVPGRGCGTIVVGSAAYQSQSG